MRCRIRPTASSASCLWITDDVLSETFERWLRVSNAQRYHAKRFWSNAPGPLEARRRVTRRRMGLEAVANSHGPPPFDMGALFGLGVKPGQDMEKGMSWERPRLPGTRSNDGDFWDFTSHKRGTRKQRKQNERIAHFLEVPKDPVQSSKAGFDALLAAVSPNEELHRFDIRPLLDYLESTANEPEACLTAKLFGWLLERSTSEDALWPLTDVVRQKLALRTLSEAEAEHILQLLHEHDTESQHFIAIAESLPGDWAPRIMTSITQRLLNHTEADSLLQSLHRWVVRLRDYSRVDGFEDHTKHGWNTVYTAISAKCMPSDLAEHFSRLQRKEVALVLLRHWAPRLAAESLGDAPVSMDAYSKRRLRFNPAPLASLDLPVFEADIERLQASRSSRYLYTDPIVNLFRVLAERRVRYQGLLAEVVTIYYRTEPANKLRNFIKAIIRLPSVDVGPVLATSVIRSFIESDYLEYALQIFEAVPSVALSEFYDLPMQLIEQQKIHGERAFAMLNRLVPQDTVPEEDRVVPKLLLTPQHCDIVHLVAYAYAACLHIHSRTALRRVWECYRFLKDRSAPLDPLLSRALVKAGITRPLSEGKRPSAEQTAYILGIVQQLEGDDVARNLDELVFTVGQRLARGEDVLATSRHRQSQQRRDAHDQRLVRATEAQLKVWRPRGWTKGLRLSRASSRVPIHDQCIANATEPHAPSDASHAPLCSSDTNVDASNSVTAFAPYIAGGAGDHGQHAESQILGQGSGTETALHRPTLESETGVAQRIQYTNSSPRPEMVQSIDTHDEHCNYQPTQDSIIDADASAVLSLREEAPIPRASASGPQQMDLQSSMFSSDVKDFTGSLDPADAVHVELVHYADPVAQTSESNSNLHRGLENEATLEQSAKGSEAQKLPTRRAKSHRDFSTGDDGEQLARRTQQKSKATVTSKRAQGEALVSLPSKSGTERIPTPGFGPVADRDLPITNKTDSPTTTIRQLSAAWAPSPTNPEARSFSITFVSDGVEEGRKRDLSQRAWLVEERRAARNNAEHWQAFATRFRRRRVRTRYDTMAKEKRGKKDQKGEKTDEGK